MSSKTTWLAMVALPKPQLPDPAEILAAINSPQKVEPQPELASQTEGMATFQWEEATIGVTLVDRPIPQSQLAGPCEAAWYWPEAASALAKHRAHLLITLIDEGRDPIEKCIRLSTFAMAGAASTPNAIAIIWGPSGLVHEPFAFAEQAVQMTPDSLPLFLWIDFRIEASGDKYRLYTSGLEAFERKELEVADCEAEPQSLLNDVYNVAHYMIDQPSELKDSDTIGLENGRKMIARHEPSLLGDDRHVIRLEYE